MMVNGTDHAVAGSLVSGQDMTGVIEPNAICQGATGPNMQRAANLTLHQEMDRHGIRMPPGRAEGFEDRYPTWIPTATLRNCRSASNGTSPAQHPAQATSWLSPA
ncbi:hypothetical protein [Marinobacterium weihaiense]|uniref:Uncharacterized protein n=1 Tax=Marinobacterium weihaiense TaxID=2851016 RepID=A0ABS6MAH4_9GAMM|nr:hypothetical protein [Marinobacterium weihaiense]MBV0933294.1 hypothetical protein [Marinobacterium weihaiense]